MYLWHSGIRRSSIVRAIDDDIRPIYTEKRLSRNLNNDKFSLLLMTDMQLHASAPLPKMRIQFGTILSLLMILWMNENMVWTDSQDYGADEILSHLFTVISPVQRAACALPFEGSVPSRTNRNHSINQSSTTLFNLSHFLEGCVPNFSNG